MKDVGMLATPAPGPSGDQRKRRRKRGTNFKSSKARRWQHKRRALTALKEDVSTSTDRVPQRGPVSVSVSQTALVVEPGRNRSKQLEAVAEGHCMRMDARSPLREESDRESTDTEDPSPRRRQMEDFEEECFRTVRICLISIV